MFIKYISAVCRHWGKGTDKACTGLAFKELCDLVETDSRHSGKHGPCSKYGWSPSDSDSMYTFSTLQWWKNNIHCVKNMLQHLDFDLFLDEQHQAPHSLRGWTAAARVTSCKPHHCEGEQLTLYRALCCQFASFCVWYCVVSFCIQSYLQNAHLCLLFLVGRGKQLLLRWNSR